MIKFRLSYKFFAAFSITALVAVGLMIGLIWFNFSHDFAKYTNEIASEKYGSISIDLINVYKDKNSWDKLRNNNKLWKEILTKPLFKIYTHSNPNASLGFDEFLKFKAKVLMVLDANKDYVIGGMQKSPAPPPLSKFTLREVRLHDKVIGFWGIYTHEYLSNPAAKGFLIQQLHSLYFIGGLILLLSMVVSFLLSKHLIVPISELTKGAHELSKRNFKTRIEIKSSDELGELAQDFNNMAKTLDQYENLRKQWIADIAHELRTPLLILSGELEALKDGVRETNTKSIEAIYSEAKHLGKIINDLHELSMADSGALSLKMESVKPQNILAEALKQFEKSFEARNIQTGSNFVEGHEVLILADSGRLRQLFSNLLENALKYMNAPGKLHVGASATNDRITLFIEDSGPGVSQDDLPHLFERLYRVDKSRNRNHGGSGLGLSICRSIVKGFSGDIRAINCSIGGLRIEIEFPTISEGSSNE